MSATSSWIAPSTRPELIETLVSGVDRYNPSNVGILEDYLYHQTRTREYDCLANLAILKLYQFNPVLYNPDVVVNILIKALTALPHPDFNLCIALLGERPIGANLDEPDPLPSLLPFLTALHSMLQQCRFSSFWSLYRSDELETLRDNYTIEVAHFEDSVRDVVVKSVQAAFTKIGADRLGTYLDLIGADLQEFASKYSWTFDEATSSFSIPVNLDNQPEVTVVRENIKLPQLTKIVSYAIHA